MEIKIDTWGSCVIRDIFRFCSTEDYRICTGVARQSIPSIEAVPLYFDESNLDWGNASNYEKKQLVNGLKNVGLELLKKSEGEWLILDLAEDRFDMYQIQTDYGIATGLNTPLMKQMIGRFIQSGIIDNNKYNIQEFDKIDWRIIERSYKKFADTLSKKYSQEKIIIVETKEAKKILKNTLDILEYPSDTRERRNAHLTKVYDLLRSLLPQAHYIKMPENTLMSENHIWGGCYHFIFGNRIINIC